MNTVVDMATALVLAMVLVHCGDDDDDDNDDRDDDDDNGVDGEGAAEHEDAK